MTPKIFARDGGQETGKSTLSTIKKKRVCISQIPAALSFILFFLPLFIALHDDLFLLLVRSFFPFLSQRLRTFTIFHNRSISIYRFYLRSSSFLFRFIYLLSSMQPRISPFSSFSSSFALFLPSLSRLYICPYFQANRYRSNIITRYYSPSDEFSPTFTFLLLSPNAWNTV